MGALTDRSRQKPCNLQFCVRLQLFQGKKLRKFLSSDSNSICRGGAQSMQPAAGEKLSGINLFTHNSILGNRRVHPVFSGEPQPRSSALTGPLDSEDLL